jgi:broad specificity phosphatase PhoE
MSVILFLGRHGETQLNSEDKLRGWLDVPLNKDGLKEAVAMGEYMSKTKIDRVYSSDLDRADRTARIVAEHHDLKVITRQWFRPLDYGDMAGKSLKDIQPKLDELNEIWKTDPDHAAPGGESFSEFQSRNLQGLHAILKNAEDGEQIMLVAHLRNCLLFHAVAVSGGPLEGDSIQLMDGKSWHQESGSVSKFEFEPEGAMLKFIDIVFSPTESAEKAMVS